MTAEALEHLIRIAPRGTTITIVTIPGQPDDVHVTAPVGGGEDDPEELPSTLEEAVKCTIQREGQCALKPDEWAARLADLSAREIKRAIKARVIESHLKATGRDHGATVISAEAMLRYVQMREQVMAGSEPQPAWFDDVVKR